MQVDLEAWRSGFGLGVQGVQISETGGVYIVSYMIPALLTPLAEIATEMTPVPLSGSRILTSSITRLSLASF